MVIRGSSSKKGLKEDTNILLSDMLSKEKLYHLNRYTECKSF